MPACQSSQRQSVPLPPVVRGSAPRVYRAILRLPIFPEKMGRKSKRHSFFSTAFHASSSPSPSCAAFLSFSSLELRHVGSSKHAVVCVMSCLHCSGSGHLGREGRPVWSAGPRLPPSPPSSPRRHVACLFRLRPGPSSRPSRHCHCSVVMVGGACAWHAKKVGTRARKGRHKARHGSVAVFLPREEARGARLGAWRVFPVLCVCAWHVCMCVAKSSLPGGKEGEPQRGEEERGDYFLHCFVSSRQEVRFPGAGSGGRACKAMPSMQRAEMPSPCDSRCMFKKQRVQAALPCVRAPTGYLKCCPVSIRGEKGEEGGTRHMPKMPEF